MYGFVLLGITAILVFLFLYHRWKIENVVAHQEQLFKGDTFEEEAGAEILYEPRCRHLGTIIEGTRTPYLLQNMNYRGEGELRITTRVIRFKALLGPETFYIPTSRVRSCFSRTVRRWGIQRMTINIRWVRAGKGLLTQFLVPLATARKCESAIASILKR
ncbi:MAG: hypothetical protein V2G42_08135 [bacterium JZ-2024 1]